MTTSILARATLYADRDAWLAARPGHDRTSIGASEVANILGIGFRTSFEFWQLRTEGAPDEDIDRDLSDESEDLSPTDPRSRGNRWEPVVIDEYNAVCTPRRMTAAGAHLGAPGTLVTVRHPTIPWMTASPDAFVVDEGELGGGECKTSLVSPRLWGPHNLVIQSLAAYEAMPEEAIPGAYYTQCQWQAGCLDVPFVDLAVLLGSYRLRRYRIVRDDACIRQLVDHIGTWRDRHLVRGEPPPIDGSVGARGWLSRRYAAIKSRERRATPEEAEKVRAYALAKAQEKASAAAAAQLRNEIALAMGSAYRLYLGDGQGVTLSAGVERRLILTGF